MMWCGVMYVAMWSADVKLHAAGWELHPQTGQLQQRHLSWLITAVIMSLCDAFHSYSDVTSTINKIFLYYISCWSFVLT